MLDAEENLELAHREAPEEKITSVLGLLKESLQSYPARRKQHNIQQAIDRPGQPEASFVSVHRRKSSRPFGRSAQRTPFAAGVARVCDSH